MQNTKIKLSIIVPVYNEEKYLPILFESIKKQSVIVDEIIVCDNGSTDESIELINEWKSKLPIKLCREKKKGIIYCVDKAWRQAKGELIFKVDADSVLPDRWAEKLVAHFDSDSELSACTGPLMGCDGNWLKLIWGYPLLVGPNSAFRKTALERINGYSGAKKGNMDDQYISKRIYEMGYRSKIFLDTWNGHSTRRFQGKPWMVIEVVLSIFFDGKYYKEKDE